MAGIVFKYSLTLQQLALREGLMSFDIPEGAELISVREQGASVCLWYACDPRVKCEERQFIVVGTGQPAPVLKANANPDGADEVGKPLGSCHFHDGSLILHVFERVQK